MLDLLLSKQGGHMKNVVANDLWPDLNPTPCPGLVWKSVAGPEPSLCQ